MQSTGLIDLSTGANSREFVEQVCRESIIDKNVCYLYPGLKTLELACECECRFSAGVFRHLRGRWRSRGQNLSTFDTTLPH
jgi:hypothetical protein